MPEAHQYDLTLFGASGRTGIDILNQATDRGLKVLAIDHSMPDEPEARKGIEHRTADVLEDDLAPLVADSAAVISALGVAFSPKTAIDPPPLYSKGTGRIIAAMKEAGRDRLCVISAAFAAERANLPLWFEQTVVRALGSILEDMREMEEALRSSSLNWTAARPGWLLDRPRTQSYHVSTENLPDGAFRTRHGDLAHFLIECALHGDHGKSAPFLARRESKPDESPAALGKETLSMIGLA
ncbi:NAD(P)H-binding protein [Parvularcula sp. ZS-1/3]|uniref:NAD(P)H-binding protein n=1 Tax=Parvularcula mediterranea TaxID=2732508 RepID=A0A7Y3W5S2_9PROT|nr:NAD(P)H-binding protein [Parvularcula mediterranea]NNU16627.1 NAD(P)H-binding protein [Parvularcula mediterranea]